MRVPTLREIHKSNSLLRQRPPGFVALVVGCTSGIGASALQELVTNLNAPKVYVVGRSEKRFQQAYDELKSSNHAATICFIEAEVTLLRDIDGICKYIASRETRLDLLFMSAGLIALGGPHYTSEGIDRCASISYYARMRLTSNLLPLLENASAPRVHSVLAGGNEREILTDDLGLDRDYSVIKVINQTTTMHTLSFEYLAEKHPSVSFIHAYPGWVSTGVQDKVLEANPKDWHFVIFWLLRWVIRIGLHIVGISPAEAGARQFFYATSERYPSKDQIERDASSGSAKIRADCSVSGNGMYRLDWRGNGVTRSHILEVYRGEGLRERAWEHTLEVFEKAHTS